MLYSNLSLWGFSLKLRRYGSYNAKSLLIVVDSPFNSNHRVYSLLLEGFLKPKVGVSHVTEALLKLIEVHSDLNHAKTDCFSHGHFEILRKLALQVVQDCLILLVAAHSGLARGFIQHARLIGAFQRCTRV